MSPAELRRVPTAGCLGDLERSFAPLDAGQPRDPRRLVPAPASLLGPPVEVDDGVTMRAMSRGDVSRVATLPAGPFVT